MIEALACDNSLERSSTRFDLRLYRHGSARGCRPYRECIGSLPAGQRLPTCIRGRGQDNALASVRCYSVSRSETSPSHLLYHVFDRGHCVTLFRLITAITYWYL